MIEPPWFPVDPITVRSLLILREWIDSMLECMKLIAVVDLMFAFVATCDYSYGQ